MSNKKYTLVKSDTVTTRDGRKLYRIKALAAIEAFGIEKGDLGGYVESEANLSASGGAWVSGSARVYGGAWVSGNALVYGSARVYGGAWVSGNARVYGDALVSDNARVYGDALVSDNARVYGGAWVYGDALVYAPIAMATRSDGYTFLVTPTPKGPRIIAGCRYFTFDQARKHWTDTRGGTPLGEESLAIVDHLERMAAICGYVEPVAGEEA